jgi:hypothetical protein
VHRQPACYLAGRNEKNRAATRVVHSKILPAPY